MPGKSRAQQAVERRRPDPIKRRDKRAGIPVPDEAIGLAQDYAMLGATNEEIAALLDISPSTFETWAVESPAIKRALLKGRELANVRVVKSMHAAATGYSHPDVKHFVVGGKLKRRTVTKHYPPSVNAAALLLYNRDRTRWRDAKSIDVNGKLSLVGLLDDMAQLEPGAGAKVIEGEATEADSGE